MRKWIWIAALLCCIGTTTAVADDGFKGGRTDFRDETIYFVITTRFYDGDETNNVMCWDNQAAQLETKDPCWRGDFKGLIERLDYIKALGFTAIWITPVVQNASGYDYHGYHAMDFTKVDLRYESRQEWGANEDVKFSDLLEAVHARGMKLILDIVLNHSGNFGEATLCKMFERDQQIHNQATIKSSMLPQEVIGGSSYWMLPSGSQYQKRLAMMKNVDGQNHDSRNLYHHFGNFNWDDHTRWYAQIAGDCVDVNTENPQTYRYLRECYGEFIKMGVDGFRIDTSGHIPRVTFNQAFVPYFLQLGEEYRDRRPGGEPFYLFGEVCAKSGTVLYRNESVACSPFFYTWKGSDYGWTEDEQEWEASIMVTEDCKSFQQTNLKACEAEWAQYGGSSTTDFQSTNAFLNGNDYHEPDYSQASGLHVIDFPIHYNFSNAGKAIALAKEGDRWYNDATWNVVYVDSHDYGPQDNGYKNRFNGGTAQWAENLSLMFTFRGIPCLYYGSEVEFQAGKEIDKGPNGPLSDTGRAYFGEYLKGEVTASDFGNYQAEGNVATTLGGDLSQHIIRLNKIRAAVPALRKGQYSFAGCTGKDGGYAFKRRYTQQSSNEDSYALVCISGGATFTGILNGTYRECVTGEEQVVTNGSLTATCSGKGNLRVWVLDGPGKVGDDGMYAYASQPVAKGGKPQFTDTGATRWYSADDGDYQEPTPAPDPDAHDITIYVTATTAPYLYIWDDNIYKYNGEWPGKLMTATVTVGNTDYYSQTVSNVTRLNIIFNNGKGGQTADIKGITKDSWFSYDGNRSYQQLDAPTSISDIPNANATNPRSSLLFPLNIYTLTGIHVATLTNMSQLHQLQSGVYVAGKQKIVIR
jgi:glycosidase